MCGCGTLGWTIKTGGNLSTLDRTKYVASAVIRRASVKFTGKQLTKIRNLEIEDILPPDSAICTAAKNLSAEYCPNFLNNHNWRSYFWARLLNGSEKFDDEALFVGLMLHDLGLTEKFSTDDPCFTLPAAREAQNLAQAHGWTSQRGDLVANAICLHLNVNVGRRHGREAELVRMGSGADIAGLGLKTLPSEQISQLVSLYPRHNLKRHIVPLLEQQAVKHPQSRISVMMNNFKFGNMIAHARCFSE